MDTYENVDPGSNNIIDGCWYSKGVPLMTSEDTSTAALAGAV